MKKEIKDKIRGMIEGFNSDREFGFGGDLVGKLGDEILEIFEFEKEKERQATIEKILNKIEVGIDGRDITIYELGDWLEKFKVKLKDEK